MTNNLMNAIQNRRLAANESTTNSCHRSALPRIALLSLFSVVVLGIPVFTHGQAGPPAVMWEFERVYIVDHNTINTTVFDKGYPAAFRIDLGSEVQWSNSGVSENRIFFEGASLSGGSIGGRLVLDGLGRGFHWVKPGRFNYWSGGTVGSANYLYVRLNPDGSPPPFRLVGEISSVLIASATEYHSAVAHGPALDGHGEALQPGGVPSDTYTIEVDISDPSRLRGAYSFSEYPGAQYARLALQGLVADTEVAKGYPPGGTSASALAMFSCDLEAYIDEGDKPVAKIAETPNGSVTVLPSQIQPSVELTSASYDPDNPGTEVDRGIIDWEWRIERPDGSEVIQEGPRVTAAWDKEGVYEVELMVTDDEGMIDVVTGQVIVIGPTPRIVSYEYNAFESLLADKLVIEYRLELRTDDGRSFDKFLSLIDLAEELQWREHPPLPWNQYPGHKWRDILLDMGEPEEFLFGGWGFLDGHGLWNHLSPEFDYSAEAVRDEVILTQQYVYRAPWTVVEREANEIGIYPHVENGGPFEIKHELLRFYEVQVPKFKSLSHWVLRVSKHSPSWYHLYATDFPR
ncbi:MAG: hypothetical protein HONBIEJF_01036 [Fimbriimonadaceae bacterium]|nr:hypothetical protein [Fimbriimonadaceae bacterium]